MNVPLWLWILTIGVTTAILLFDVFIIGRRPHVPSNKETGFFSNSYVLKAGGHARHRIEVELFQVGRHVLQHGGFVLKRLNLIVDLCKRARSL